MGHQAHSLRRHSARSCTRTRSTRIRGGARIANRSTRIGCPDGTWIRLNGSARIYRAQRTWIGYNARICCDCFSSSEKIAGGLKKRAQKGNSEDPRDNGKQSPAQPAWSREPRLKQERIYQSQGNPYPYMNQCPHKIRRYMKRKHTSQCSQNVHPGQTD